MPLTFIETPVLTSVSSNNCELQISGDFFTVDLSFEMVGIVMECAVVSETEAKCNECGVGLVTV